VSSPAPFNLPVPANPAVVGADLYVQGALVDPTPGASVLIGLTEALQLCIGP